MQRGGKPPERKPKKIQGISSNNKIRVRDSFRIRTESLDFTGERVKFREWDSRIGRKKYGSHSDRAINSTTQAHQSLVKEQKSGELEPMIVLVTVFSLSGLSVKRLPRRSRSWMSPGKTRTDVSAFRAVVNTPCSVAAPRQPFLPSVDLKRMLSLDEDGAVQLSAYWQGSEVSDETSESAQSHTRSTLQVERTMRRISYRKNVHVGQVPHFIPTHIDLNIGVCYGTEMITLGGASIAVLGDEEEMVVSNVPVRPTYAKRGKGSSSAKSRIPSTSFDMDPDLFFGLDHLATLRVGVRVLPSNVVSRDCWWRSGPIDFPHGAETIVFADENSLLSALVPSETRNDLGCSGLFNFWQCSSPFTSCCAVEPQKYARGINPMKGLTTETEVEVTPFHVLSDVSESTFSGTDDEFDE